MAAALQDASESSENPQEVQNKFLRGDLSEDDGSLLALRHDSTRENHSTDGKNIRADSPLFAQNVRDKDRLAIFRASNRELKMQKKASLRAAVDTNAQKEAELEDIKRRGLDGNSNQVYAQLKREKTEITMHVSDHKSERLKRTGRKLIGGNKADSFYNSVQLASMSKLPQLQRACWEVTNFVPLKIHSATQSAAAQASHVREVTEDPAVLKALRQLFDLLEVFSNQSEQFLTMLCKDTEVAVVTVPAGTRAATKGQPMVRSLVLLSGQAHHLSYAGESYILLEESHSTRMNTGDCLGFIDDNEECIQENAFTIACQTTCSFLEITKASFDEIYNQIKFERFLVIMNVSPEERSEKDLEFLCQFAKKNAFFKQLKESRQMNLCRQAKMEQWKFDDTLFNEDERGQIYYIIIRGSVRVLKNVGGALDNQGKKILQQVALLGPGVGFGELALLSSAGVRQATVIANENSVFMTLSRKTYNEVLRGEHEHSLNETIRAIVHVFPYVGQRDRIFQTYIAQLFREEELPTGHVVVNQGAKAATFYILKEGALSIDCRVEFSRFCPPTEAGFLHSEDNFETKTLKKFTEKEFKTRIVPFGELSSFGDTIGDMDMLAVPIWSATYMYRATVSKPVVLCSISWAALKVRFPPEMLEDLQTRLLQKFALFKKIFNSAVVTECSNSKFCCLSDFHPIGYVQKTNVDEKLKSSAKLSLGEQLEEKKSKLRRHVRNRMDVLPAQAFQTTVNEWIVDMSYEKVLLGIEAAADELKKIAGHQTNALEPLLACANAKKDIALQSVMRSAFLDEENIDLCIENIIKMTSNHIEKEITDSEINFNSFRASQRFALKSAETRALSPNSVRAIRTPIPGHKPQFVRYNLTEQYCNVVEEPMFIVDDLILLDSSVVQTRPSSSVSVFTSRSKFKQRNRSIQRTDTSGGTSADEIDSYHRVASPVYDVHNSNATDDARFQAELRENDVHSDFPEYFYPANYNVRSSKARTTKNRAMMFKKQRELKKLVCPAAAISFESSICTTPIQLKPLNGHVRMPSPRLSSQESPALSPIIHANPPVPPFDKCVLSVKTFKNDPLRLSSGISLQHKQSVSQTASQKVSMIDGSEKDESEKLLLSISDLVQDKTQPLGVFAGEKQSTRPTDDSEFKVFHDDSTDDEHMQGATCSPDVTMNGSSAVQEIDIHQRPVSREDKLKEILKSRFTVVREQDADTKRLQAETIERLKLNHAHQEKQKSQAETKSKIANLFSKGLLNNTIKHLEETRMEPIHFELSQTLLDKMNDVVVRRMNDPNFEGQKFDLKLPSGISGTAKPQKKTIPAACLKNFDFDGFEPLFSGKMIKFDDVTRSSYHNEQMLKIQNRNSDEHKAQRQQLLKNVLSKSNRGPTFGALQVGKTALPAVISASPKQHR